MDDGIDAVLADHRRHQLDVADIADDELRLGRHGPFEPCRQPVNHDDILAGVQQFPHHMTADIAGATRHENSHAQRLPTPGLGSAHRKASQQALKFRTARLCGQFH